MAIERVERGLDALLLVPLLGEGQVFDAWQRLARGRLRSRPGLVLHHMIMELAGGFRTSEAANRPEGEAGDQAESDCEAQERLVGLPRDQPAALLEQRRDRVHRRDAVDPTFEERERDVHGREEEEDEDRHLHHGERLLRAQPHRDTGRPERPREADEQTECVEADEIDAVAADLHPHCERNNRNDDDHRRPARQRRRHVTEQDAAAIRSGEHQPPHEPALPVAGNPEAREDSRERRRLQQDEDELERRVPERKVEARDVADAREAADEGGEEEQREEERRDDERRVREEDVRLPPPHTTRDVQRVSHVRSSRLIRAWEASAKPTRHMATATPKPSMIVSQFQSSITSERTASIRYETGLIVATQRNQSVSMKSRGMFSDERKRKTKKTGKSPCTASVEPVRSAAQQPNDAKASAIIASSTSRTSAPPTPVSNRTPKAMATAR